MHDPIVLQRLAELPPPLRKLAESDFPQAAAQSLGQASQLTEGQTQILGNGFFLYLIFILNGDELLSFLTEEAFIDAEEATALIDAFLAVLPDEIKNIHLVNASEETRPPHVSVNQEGVYVSSQATILRPDTPPSSDAARWGQV